MARLVAGAVVSDNSQWFFTGFGWKPLVEGATDKPGIGEFQDANKLATLRTGSAGKKLAARLAAGEQVPELNPSGPEQKVITYRNRAEFEREAPRMLAAGWRVQSQDSGSDHTTAGRVGTGAVVGTVLMPGFGTLVGGALGAASKKKGAVTVVYER